MNDQEISLFPRCFPPPPSLFFFSSITKCFPFPNISLYFPLRPSSPSLIRCFLSRNLFQLHKKIFASKCFPIRYFLYKNIFFLFRHRYLSSKRQNIFLPFLLHYSYVSFLLILAKNLRNLDQNQGSAHSPTCLGNLVF